jgi:signal transduction histidine kinase
MRLNEELVEMNRAVVASQADLTRARSLLMVGEMAAGAAHELNNPLAVISGRAQILIKEITDPQQARACRLIVDHAERASAIVNELIAFAKPDPPKPDTWSPAWLLGEIRREWIEKGAILAEEFSLSLSDELPKVHADASQIRKLFDEVIRNALDAMTESSPRRLDINCSAHLADERIVVSVRDNGRGIPPEILDRVTTPFFSHRQAGRGRGLGLSLATRYAEINGGRLRISSRSGEGTTVAITLPTAT